MAPPHCLPLHANISGQAKYIKDKKTIHLTQDQARHVYKKGRDREHYKGRYIKQEIEQDLDRMDNISGDIYPYHKIIVNKAERNNMILSQMEQWSILRYMVNYVQYDKHPKNFHNLDIRPIDQKKYKKMKSK